ncbi:MAG: hypothetical protein ACT4PK_11535, partial [Gammaproteobacteria bacterium]
VGTVTTAAGRVGELYKFTGDSFGNTELVAYFVGKHTINYFVMTAKTPDAFKDAESALKELARSYREADDCKPCCDKPLPETLEAAAKIGDAQENGENTRPYFRNQLMPVFGQGTATALPQCFKKLDKPDASPLHFVVAIDARGRVQKVYRDKATNVFECLNESLQKAQFPPPPEAPYFLNMKLKFTE